jgi:biotin operon repressor
MEMIGKVRGIKLRELLSNCEIAKRTGLSRNTIKTLAAVLKATGLKISIAPVT